MTYTPEQYGRELDKRMQSFKDARWFYTCASDALGNLGRRVFGKGELGATKKKYSYSTKPMYASKSQFAKTGAFNPQSGRKTMFLPQGYKQLREVQGRQTNSVDLRYRGTFEMEFMNSLQKQGLSWVAGVNGEESTGKAEGFDKKYNKPFTLTKEERDEFKNCVYKRALELLTK